MEDYKCNDCGEVNTAEDRIMEFEGFDHKGNEVCFHFCPDCESSNLEEVE